MRRGEGIRKAEMAKGNKSNTDKKVRRDRIIWKLLRTLPRFIWSTTQCEYPAEGLASLIIGSAPRTHNEEGRPGLGLQTKPCQCHRGRS